MKIFFGILITSTLLINASTTQAQEAPSDPCAPNFGEEIVWGVSGKYVNIVTQLAEGPTLTRVPVTDENFDKEQATSEALNDASRQLRKISRDQQYANGVVIVGKPLQSIHSDPSRSRPNLTLAEHLAAAVSPTVGAMLSFTKRGGSPRYPRMIVPVIHLKGYPSIEAYRVYRCELAKQCSSKTLAAMSTVPAQNFREEDDRQEKLKLSNGFEAEFCQ